MPVDAESVTTQGCIVGAMTAPEPIVGRIEVVLSDAQLLELLRQADADTTTDDHTEEAD